MSGETFYTLRCVQRSIRTGCAKKEAHNGVSKRGIVADCECDVGQIWLVNMFKHMLSRQRGVERA